MIAGASILLVEDSDTQALQLRRMFERAGFRVDRTRDAESALATLNEARPDLLVVDYRLPGMNGDELVRIVRQTGTTRTLPVMMLTGDDASDIERQGLDSGANAYVPKRGGGELILSRIRSLLRQSPSRPAEDNAGPAPALRQARLLLLDTDSEARDPLVERLASDGYQVERLADPTAAIAAITDNSADGILVVERDRNFTLSSRLDNCRVERASAIALVALTDDAESATMLAGLAAGVDDVVARHGDGDMMLVRIRAIVRRKLARDEEAVGVARERAQAVALAQARAEADSADRLARANAELAGANALLRETQAQLVQSAKMASLGELVAGIAHEINNPLAFILAHQATVERAVAAARDADDASRAQLLTKASDRLASIRSGLTRIQELVVKLRRFSRLDDGEVSQIDIPEAIDAVLTLLAPRLGTVTVDRDYGPQRLLECSGALVNQVVMNIVANAADAVDPASGEILIATGIVDGAYTIRIDDNGPGIADDKRERIFEPFFTTKDVGSGTGLGLAIAYGVVRSHHGTIEVGRAARGGASFVIKIPERA
ncbi:hybrid sensor histidine kinase/response regulator [Nostoc sp. 3335mG]|nr:hybrid sensor histidine kinase/response regulator [Nostoc sp. 3335mG]